MLYVLEPYVLRTRSGFDRRSRPGCVFTCSHTNTRRVLALHDSIPRGGGVRLELASIAKASPAGRGGGESRLQDSDMHTFDVHTCLLMLVQDACMHGDTAWILTTDV